MTPSSHVTPALLLSRAPPPLPSHDPGSVPDQVTKLIESSAAKWRQEEGVRIAASLFFARMHGVATDVPTPSGR